MNSQFFILSLKNMNNVSNYDSTGKYLFSVKPPRKNMIKSFGDKELEQCWQKANCRKISANLKNRVLMKLEWLDAATCIDDIQNPPSNHLHKLSGNYEKYWAISVNGPWRLVFQFEGSDAYDVQLVQYH